MKEQLQDLEKRALKDLEAVSDASELENFRVKYLGKKGLITSSMRKLGEVPPSERPELGKLANLIKSNLSNRLVEAHEYIASGKTKQVSFLDVTLPGREPLRGHLHPITLVNKEICQIFSRMGFSVVKGPNVKCRIKDPYFPYPSPSYGNPKTSSQHYCSWKGLQEGFRCISYPHVPSGRGPFSR
jgi:phenylalanyl-tRNA synthetase alpha chain